jgi:tetratricopeptide (TPR) repeat protein
LNNVAWSIAADPTSNEVALGLALQLAERAAAETDRQDAPILDTLAEVHFRLGEIDEAVTIIDEAIALLPDRDYYHEQRRRFLGERDAEDRPHYDPEHDRGQGESDELRV